MLSRLPRRFTTCSKARVGSLNAFISPQVVDGLFPVTPKVGGKGENKRLDGLSIAVKDNICTVKQPTTCASEILDGFISPFAATAVRLLEEAGATIVGKTNLDEFGMGFV